MNIGSFTQFNAVILGDTYNSSSLLSAAQGADVLVHECTILEEDASEAVKRSHSTASKLHLCHFSFFWGEIFLGAPLNAFLLYSYGWKICESYWCQMLGANTFRL